MVPVLGGEVEEGEQSFPILRQAGDRLVVVGAVFVGDTSIATSAAARVGASRVSTAEKFFAKPTDAAESGNLATDLILRLGRRRLVALGLDLPDRSGASGAVIWGRVAPALPKRANMFGVRESLVQERPRIENVERRTRRACRAGTKTRFASRRKSLGWSSSEKNGDGAPFAKEKPCRSYFDAIDNIYGVPSQDLQLGQTILV
jgi:hypothetical protein